MQCSYILISSIFQTKSSGPTAPHHSVLQNGVLDGRYLVVGGEIGHHSPCSCCSARLIDYSLVSCKNCLSNLFPEWVFGGQHHVCHQHQRLEGAGEKGEDCSVWNPLS